MERLLAYPATLPLVHVDHSHRAPSVRTGKCLGRYNPSGLVTRAECYVNIKTENYPRKRVPIEYTIAEVACDIATTTVGNTEARRVLDQLIALAREHLPLNNDETLAISYRSDENPGFFEILAIVKPTGSEFYRDPLRKTKEAVGVHRKWEDEDTDPATSVPFIRNYLDRHVSDDNGPLFSIHPPLDDTYT